MFDPNNLPDPSTLDGGAVAMHELFTSYVRAGFSEEQALRITLTMLRESIRAQRPE